MEPRPIAALIALCLAAVPACGGVDQDLRPIRDRTERIAIPGVSVLPPQGDDWFLFPPSRGEGLEGSVIRFVRKLQGGPPARREDARMVLAGVAVLDAGEARTRTPAEFLEDFKGGLRIGEVITRRQRLMGLDTSLDDSLGTTCVRYSRLTEITGQFPVFPDLVAITSTRGLYCSHPHWPQYHIGVTYEQVYAKGQAPLPLDAEADMFLKSVAFSSARPVAVVGPKELWASHMKAGRLAYDHQRWSEAEASFQAAMKAAEYFGPQNKVLAATLYFLGSTQEKQGRPADAEPLLRRALDIFDAQSRVEDPEIAQLLGMTLNDLAVIYAGRARSAEAERDFQRGLAIQEKPDPRKQSQREEAERLLQRALAIREKSDPSQVGRTLSNLTQVYIDLGRWSDAAVAGGRAVSFYERQRGPDDKEVIYQLDRLVDIYLQQGRLAEAEPVISRVVSGMQKTLGPNDPAIARRLESYAIGLRKAGREADAREVEAQARKIRGSAPTHQ